MKDNEEIKEAIKQLNRRMMNTEAFMHMLEQRLDMSEKMTKALDEKIAKNTEKILQLDLKETPASKKDVESLRKYFELISPLKE